MRRCAKMDTDSNMTVRFSMNKCAQCVGKAHCAACGADLEELLCHVPHIGKVAINMKGRTMTISTTLDESTLEDELEKRGVFRL